MPRKTTITIPFELENELKRVYISIYIYIGRRGFSKAMSLWLQLTVQIGI
jgi:hypothetical protein